MSVILERGSQLEDVSLEVLSGLNGQGKPTYQTAVTVRARVVPGDNVVRNSAGDDVNTIATVWIPASEAVLPRFNDRITTAGGLVGIVVERMERRTVQTGVLDHVRVRIKRD